MRSLGRFCVLLVLCAAAHARPDPGANDIVVADKDSDVTGKTDSAVVTDKPESSSEPVTAELKAAAEPPTPVNERYPHAVLFGGTCGGTIISSKWILTAGHCSIRDWTDVGVRTLFSSGRHVIAGTNNTDDDSGVFRRVKRLIIHPLFSVGPYWLDADEFDIKQVGARWDFLLAELSEPLPLDGKTLKAATLDDQSSLPVGLEVGYAGYGTDHHGGTMRNNMHSMELAVQANEVCSAKLEQFNKEDMVCTKGRPPRYDSACNGDSGSGLVDDSGRLVGIASWVENDAHECRNGALVVFSRVAAVRDWIRQVTKV